MASLDKASVRENVINLKSTFNELKQSGKLTSESIILFNSMLMVIDLILSIFLEKKTKKTKDNSSIPSSQTDKDETAKSQTGAHGKGKAIKDGVANNTRVNKTVTLITVDECTCCGEDLTRAPCIEIERRTKIDIIFEKTVEHMDGEVKHCSVCDATVKATFPTNMSSPLHYGNGLKAYVINLLICQMVSLKRITVLIQSIFAIVLSEATILKFVLRLHQALGEWEAKAIDTLLSQAALHVDETSLRVNKKNHWIHVYSSGDITLKKLHPSRGGQAIEDINILPRYGGVIIHDCWASYFAYDNCQHGLCGSHILRELTFIIDANGYRWAKNMKRLLQATCKVISKRKRKKLSEKEYANLQKRYRNIITRGETELPVILTKANGKRGKIAKSDAHNLWERLKTHEASVLLFAKVADVAFTNNRAERDLRMAKVKQKVSGCFRNKDYADAYCRISSFLQTMANKGINPFIAIQMVLNGQELF